MDQYHFWLSNAQIGGCDSLNGNPELNRSLFIVCLSECISLWARCCCFGVIALVSLLQSQSISPNHNGAAELNPIERIGLRSSQDPPMKVFGWVTRYETTCSYHCHLSLKTSKAAIRTLVFIACDKIFLIIAQLEPFKRFQIISCSDFNQSF